MGNSESTSNGRRVKGDATEDDDSSSGEQNKRRRIRTVSFANADGDPELMGPILRRKKVRRRKTSDMVIMFII